MLTVFSAIDFKGVRFTLFLCFTLFLLGKEKTLTLTNSLAIPSIDLLCEAQLGT
jgi:hypothetical protein